MKIILAVDGSDCTKKALAFLVTHESLAGAEDELIVLNVQPPLPARAVYMAGASVEQEYYRDEANEVFEPIKKFMGRHPIRYRCEWVVGSAAAEIVAACRREKGQMILMGTHGRGQLGRVVMGSVAQHVVAESDVPVLLVK